jgi:hypothetical protein
MKLWKNEDARVPLALIGVLFVLISTATSLHLSQMDSRMASSMTKDTDINAADTALLYARADLARIVNYAGMEALKQMGETPVIALDPNSQYNPGGDTPDVVEFNRNWAKGMMTHTMNQYIESNYMYDRYQYRGYAVNVEPITSWNTTDIIPIYMALDRDLDPPLLAPNETYQTYWKATVPLTISIVDLASGDTIDEQDIIVGNLILARYPLLESLTSEYETRLNGADAVMTETTAFAMGYTWARGYLQYYKQKDGPENIVSNEHLALIVNGALLLDQGFVFNSADPASIIEYGMQTKRTLEGKKELDMAEFLSSAELVNGSYQVDPNADAAMSTGDFFNATEVMDAALHLDYNATPITDFLNNNSLPDGSAVRGQILDIIPQVYSTTLATGIDRQVTTIPGDHDGYESSHRIGSWGEPDSMNQMGTVSRDADVPGNLYGEIWEATWTREHVWRHYYIVEYACEKTRKVSCTDSEGNPDTCTETYMDTCYRTKHNEMTTIDTREDRVTVTLNAKENSKTSIQLNYAGTTISTGNDIDDAYTSKDVDYVAAHADRGLKEAYNQYKSDTFDPNVESNVKNRGLDGDNYDPGTFDVTAPGWLETEARYAVDEINQQIRSDVHLSPDINYMEYPNPGDAMQATAIDLTNKIKANQSRYVDKTRYYSGGKYSSCSAKTISQMREWYVDEVLYQVNKQYGGASDKINNEIDSSFDESADDVREANKNGASLLKAALCFPIGLTMRAEHVMDDGMKYGVDDIAYWDENVTLGVDMAPDYLFAEDNDGGKELINLGVRNICLMGPKGVPVLPPPNYVVHFNSWMINVEGRIDEFTLVDADNEVHPNPMFGHEAQVYKREKHTVYDPISSTLLGKNTPIEFSFSTGTFIFVPPGVKGIGDGLGGTTESSLEYGNILRK